MIFFFVDALFMDLDIIHSRCMYKYSHYKAGHSFSTPKLHTYICMFFFAMNVCRNILSFLLYLRSRSCTRTLANSYEKLCSNVGFFCSILTYLSLIIIYRSCNFLRKNTKVIIVIPHINCFKCSINKYNCT